MKQYYGCMYLGARGTDAKKNKLNLSLKVGHETLHEFMYSRKTEKILLDEFIYSACIRKKENMTS
jgi:hypothetical protein